MLEPSTSFRIVAIASNQLVGLANPSRSVVRATWTPTARRACSVRPDRRVRSVVGGRATSSIASTRSTLMRCVCCAGFDCASSGCIRHREHRVMRLAPPLRRQSSSIARMPAGAQFDLHLIVQCVVVARSPSADRFSCRDIIQAADRSVQCRAAMTRLACARTVSEHRRAGASTRSPTATPSQLDSPASWPQRSPRLSPLVHPVRT